MNLRHVVANLARRPLFRGAIAAVSLALAFATPAAQATTTISTGYVFTFQSSIRGNSVVAGWPQVALASDATGTVFHRYTVTNSLSFPLTVYINPNSGGVNSPQIFGTCLDYRSDSNQLPAGASCYFDFSMLYNSSLGRFQSVTIYGFPTGYGLGYGAGMVYSTP